jgi:hypothetical protein
VEGKKAQRERETSKYFELNFELEILILQRVKIEEDEERILEDGGGKTFLYASKQINLV